MVFGDRSLKISVLSRAQHGNTDTTKGAKGCAGAQPRCGRASDSIGVRDVCDGQSLERTVSAIVRSKSLDHRALSMAKRTHHGTAQ